MWYFSEDIRNFFIILHLKLVWSVIQRKLSLFLLERGRGIQEIFYFAGTLFIYRRFSIRSCIGCMLGPKMSSYKTSDEGWFIWFALSFLHNNFVFLVSNWYVDLSYYLIIIGSSIPIYTRINFINISLAECYYTFNYKDHRDPDYFICAYYFINFVEWFYISPSYQVLVIHPYLITIN